MPFYVGKLGYGVAPHRGHAARFKRPLRLHKSNAIIKAFLW